MRYSGGVVTKTACPGTRLDHAILAVGWGYDSQNYPYLIVKNSWGTSWGDSGYIYLEIVDV